MHDRSASPLFACSRGEGVDSATFLWLGISPIKVVERRGRRCRCKGGTLQGGTPQEPERNMYGTLASPHLFCSFGHNRGAL